MIKSYFISAIRNLGRNKHFAIINVSGLAVGIAVCLLIFLLIRFEKSFDQFHTKKDHIYRVLTQFNGNDGISYSNGVPFPVPKALRTNFPNLTVSGIYAGNDDQILILDEKGGHAIKKFKEEKGLFFVEPQFFKIFDYPLLAGDYNSLSNPNTALLTKETAERYFGNWQQAVGKTFKRNNNQVFTITGILAPIPDNTDFQIKIAASYNTVKSIQTSTDWVSVNGNHGCYFLMPEGVSATAMNRQLLQFSKKYKTGENAQNIQMAQSLNRVHFDSDASNYLGRTISENLIQTLWLIAAFILLIACVNFINLATAQAVNRAKEIGVRKVLGSSRRQLRFQFFSETALVTAAAIVLALLMTVAALPSLANILQIPLSARMLQSHEAFLFLTCLFIVVVLLAGAYPALVISRFNPIKALRSKVAASGSSGISLRRGLVIVQFFIAQALIIGTLITVRQMDFFRNHPLGFDKDAIAIISFPSDSTAQSKLDYLKDQLRKIKGIESVSFNFTGPANEGNWYSNFRFHHQEKSTDFGANLKWADADYLKTFNIRLVAGRNYLPSDTVREFLVNETLLHRLGITEPAQALNKEIDLWDGEHKGLIVGVVKDFHATSLREALPPVLMSTYKENYRNAGIKFNPVYMMGALKEVERLWNELFPDYVYEQRFLDASIANFYRQEAQLSALYKIFAALAIFLSCLGLYGLASFMAVQRIKEVGVRKVLGASVQHIVMLFSKEFLFLIGIAFLIAAPVAWYFMHQWLQEFVYRTSISWWIFMGAAGITLLVALATISSQAIKAALANPVHNLRNE